MNGDPLKVDYEAFCDDYNKKRYLQIVGRIPKVLAMEVTDKNSFMMKNLLVHSILAMNLSNSFDESIAKKICGKIQESLKSLKSQNCLLKCLDFFNHLSLLTNVSEIVRVVNKTWLSSMVTMIMEQIKTWSPARAEIDKKELKKFISVVVQIEAFLNNNKNNAMVLTKKVLQWFKTKMCTTEQKESGWPDLLSKTVAVCELTLRDEDDSCEGLLEEVRNLTSNKWKKDCAIMMCQIFAAFKSILGLQNRLNHMKNIIEMLGILYDIIRDKSLTSETYWSSITKYCCDRWDKHLALELCKTIRKILMNALERKIYDDGLISTCVNFFAVEFTIIDLTNCESRRSLFCDASRDAVGILKYFNHQNAPRGIRTITKLLSIEMKQNSLTRYQFLTKLIELTSDKNERLTFLAVRVLYAHSTQLAYAMHQLHIHSSTQPILEFETIVTILNKLNGSFCGANLKFDPLNLLYLQLKVEIDFPKLQMHQVTTVIQEIRSNETYCQCRELNINLVKATVRIMDYQVKKTASKNEICNYKMALNFNDGTRTMQMEYEEKTVTPLKEAVDCISKFLSQNAHWTDDDRKEENLSHMVRMLYKIGISLMCHQYKESACKSFHLLYQAAGIAKNIVKQTIAAGYLIENDHITDQLTFEMTNVLSSNIILKLRSVDTMDVTERTDYLMAILHFAVVTLCRKQDTVRAKKYMQVVKKLLDTHDPKEERFCAVRLKYCHVMFEMIARDPSSAITPIIYVEDIFHCFKKIHYTTSEDNQMLPAILFDLVNSLYIYTQSRHEIKQITAIVGNLWTIALTLRYVFLLGKVISICANNSLHMENINMLEIQLQQLDTIFGLKRSCINRPENASDVQDVPMEKLSQHSSCIHDLNCSCFVCGHDAVHLSMMEIASLKAHNAYCRKEYSASLSMYKFLHHHWQIGLNLPARVKMLLSYSDCLKMNGYMKEAEKILQEAYLSCNDGDYNNAALMQKIAYRMVCNAETKDSLQDSAKKPYASAIRDEFLGTSVKDEARLRQLELPNIAKLTLSPTSKVPEPSTPKTTSTRRVKKASNSKPKTATKRGIR